MGRVPITDHWNELNIIMGAQVTLDTNSTTGNTDEWTTKFETPSDCFDEYTSAKSWWVTDEKCPFHACWCLSPSFAGLSTCMVLVRVCGHVLHWRCLTTIFSSWYFDKSYEMWTYIFIYSSIYQCRYSFTSTVIQIPTPSCVFAQNL